MINRCSAVFSAFIMLVVLQVTGLAGELGPKPEIIQFDGKFVDVEIDRDPFRLKIVELGGKTLLETRGPVQFGQVIKQPVLFWLAWYFIPQTEPEKWVNASHVVSTKKLDDGLEILLAEDQSDVPVARIIINFQDDRTLKFSVEPVNKPEINRVNIRFLSGAKDRYYGMGERFFAPEYKGHRLRNWSEEGVLGLWNMSRKYPHFPFNPFPHGKDSTYFPVPFFLNPEGYGLLLDDTHYSLWDFAKRTKDVLHIENWNGRSDFVFFYGPSPLNVIEAMTAYTGRITVPKPWVFAPWNVSIGGSERLREVVATVRRERIPTSAIWSEDWWWAKRQTSGLNRHPEWALARDRYPDYEKVNDELHREGMRFLGYFQPYLFSISDIFNFAADKGYLTQNLDGTAAVMDVTMSKKGQLDVTNPEAVKWWQDTLFQRSVDWGIDGWMTDFGEYTHPYSKSFDGSDGWALHNLYPVLWAKINREFFDRAKPDGDYVFFVRAGYTGIQKYASVMWSGDSNTNWEKYDGLPSTIPAVTSAGISGFPVTATDIAGYTCIAAKPADKELFIRWAELGALLPVMRNHRGFISCVNWKFDDDRETLEIYKQYAVLHTALFPYIYTLVHEAAEKGWPVVRHMVLHYPKDPVAGREHYQFLVGDRILVAPVIKEKARSREVYLPEGLWFDYWTGERYSGPVRIVVDAPLDRLPMFIRSGSILPVFDTVIDTLVEEDREDLNGWEDANSSVKILFFGDGTDILKLWDGTEINCMKLVGKTGSCEVAGGPEKRDYKFEFK